MSDKIQQVQELVELYHHFPLLSASFLAEEVEEVVHLVAVAVVGVEVE